jgi:hypothetical protein
MNCPKCGFENVPERKDCSRCGIIFSKVKEMPAYPLESSTGNPGNSDNKAHGNLFGEIVLGVPDEVNSLYVLGRAMVLLVLVVWGCKLIFAGIVGNNAGESLLHLVNLPFHEFGHILFRPFGRFITSLGGTLGQLLFPFVCLSVLLLKTRDPFGGAVCFWWFGENFLDIAPYINDARAGVLPLIGGNTGHSSPYGFHDWEYLLTESGLLRYDHVLARLSHVFGSLLMALAIVWGGYVLFQQYKNRV